MFIVKKYFKIKGEKYYVDAIEDAKWIAWDENGMGWFYSVKPYLELGAVPDMWIYTVFVGDLHISSASIFDIESRDISWKKSLRKLYNVGKKKGNMD